MRRRCNSSSTERYLFWLIIIAFDKHFVVNANEPAKRNRPAHHSLVIRINRPTIIFLTVCVRDKRPILANPDVHRLLCDAWTVADRWSVGRYVIMPDHVHLFCAPKDSGCRLRTWISFWRYRATRMWPNESDKPVWQRDYWDTQMRQGDNYGLKWDYVRRNPVRAGLASTPEEWPFSGEMRVLRW